MVGGPGTAVGKSDPRSVSRGSSATEDVCGAGLGGFRLGRGGGSSGVGKTATGADGGAGSVRVGSVAGAHPAKPASSAAPAMRYRSTRGSQPIKRAALKRVTIVGRRMDIGRCSTCNGINRRTGDTMTLHRARAGLPRRWRGKMAPGVGFEPTTDRLTADCSTAELPRNGRAPFSASGL